MKLCHSHSKSTVRTQQLKRRAFTLVEFQMAFAIIMLVISGVISSHVFGLKLNEATRAKLSASDAARHALNKLVGDIRSAKTIDVGNGTYSAFTAITNGEIQQGSALRIFPTTDSSSYIVYYRDSSDSTLKRASTSAATPVKVAEFLTNTVIFTSENYLGAPLTDNDNNRVIGINLRFYQIRYPIMQIGNGGYFDYYQVNTKVTRRALE
jgi:Tfp pilus assembly protein PilW